ncbi:glycosyltransferase family 4 protein [Thermus antranikianii]
MKMTSPASRKEQTPRIVFLFPSLARGAYWQPVLAELSQEFPALRVFAGVWDGFLPEYSGSFKVEVIGRTRLVRLPTRGKGFYPRSLVLPSIWELISKLIAFAPDVVFTSAFSLWTFVALALQVRCKWKVVIMYDGSSPSVDRMDSTLHTLWRRELAKRADAFCTNTEGGRTYLLHHLKIPATKIFKHPYEVPIPKFYLKDAREARITGIGTTSHIRFVFVGQLIEQKGIYQLIEATSVLRTKGLADGFTVVVVGDGRLKERLQERVQAANLDDIVHFYGYVANDQLPTVLEDTDVFVFPTLEDVWGVAPLEAMAMGKPVLCSKYAGASELIEDGVNGFVVDPLDVESIASAMEKLIRKPELVNAMGRAAAETMRRYTPKDAAAFFTHVVNTLLGQE